MKWVEAVKELPVYKSLEIHIFVAGTNQKKLNLDEGKAVMAQKKLLEESMYRIVLPYTLHRPDPEEYQGLAELFDEKLHKARALRKVMRVANRRNHQKLKARNS